MDNVFQNLLKTYGITDCFPIVGLDQTLRLYGYFFSNQFHICQDTGQDVDFKEIDLSGTFILEKKKDQYFYKEADDKDSINRQSYIVVMPNKQYKLIDHVLHSPDFTIYAYNEEYFRQPAVVDLSIVQSDFVGHFDTDSFLLIDDVFMPQKNVICIFGMNWNYLLIEKVEEKTISLISKDGKTFFSLPDSSFKIRYWVTSSENFCLFFVPENDLEKSYVYVSKFNILKEISFHSFHREVIFDENYIIFKWNSSRNDGIDSGFTEYEIVDDCGEKLCNNEEYGALQWIKNGILQFYSFSSNGFYDDNDNFITTSRDVCISYYDVYGTRLGETSDDTEYVVVEKELQNHNSIKRELKKYKGLLRVQDASLIVPIKYDNITYRCTYDQDRELHVWAFAETSQPTLSTSIYQDSTLIKVLMNNGITQIVYNIGDIEIKSNYFYYVDNGKYHIFHQEIGFLEDEFEKIEPLRVPLEFIMSRKYELESLIDNARNKLKNTIIVNKNNCSFIMKRGQVLFDSSDRYDSIQFSSLEDDGYYITIDKDKKGVLSDNNGLILSANYYSIIVYPRVKLINADDKIFNLDGIIVFDPDLVVEEYSELKYIDRVFRFSALVDNNLYSIDDSGYNLQIDATHKLLTYITRNAEFIVYKRIKKYLFFDYYGNEIEIFSQEENIITGDGFSFDTRKEEFLREDEDADFESSDSFDYWNNYKNAFENDPDAEWNID